MDPCARSLFLAVLSLPLACGVADDGGLAAVRATLVPGQETLDLGETDVGVPLDGMATFRNRGDGPATLRARLEPEGSAFSVVDPATTVQPGQEGRVAVRFLAFVPDTRGSATLVVEHDGARADGGATRLEVALRGRTRPQPSCDDGNPCTADRADPQSPSGCAHHPVRGSCDDGDACTQGDSCENGLCVGAALSCDDGWDCTADTCDPGTGCVHTPTDTWCADGDPCSVDTCQPGPGANPRGCVHTTALDGTLCGPPSCAALPVCLGGVCSTLSAPDGFPCDDGNPCTVGDVCARGACLAGVGGTLQASGPFLVAEGEVEVEADTRDRREGPPVDTQRRRRPSLGGRWPVAVDAVLPYLPPGPVAAASTTLVLWRGATDPGSAWSCMRAPGDCITPTFPDPSVDAMPRPTLGLALTRVSADGLAWDTAILPHEDVLHRLGLSTPLATCDLTPVGAVAAAGAASTSVGLVGAAIVNFAQVCAPFRGTTVPSEGIVDHPSGVSRPVLTVFRGGSGFLAPRLATLLDTGGGLLVHGRDGLPLLAVAAHGDELAVAWATLDLPDPEVRTAGTGEVDEADVDCVAEPWETVTLHLVRYDVAADVSWGGVVAHPEETLVLGMEPAGDTTRGRLSDLAVAHVGGAWRLSWLRRAESWADPVESCDPGGVPNLPQTENRYDLWVGWPGGDDLWPAPFVAMAWVNAAGVAQDADGPVTLAWSRQGLGDYVCPAVDVVSSWRGGDVTRVARREDMGAAVMATAAVGSGLGRAVMVSTTAAGGLVFAAAASGGAPPLVLELSWLDGSDAWAYPGATPRLADLGNMGVVGMVAEVGNNADGAPWPVLAVAQLGCQGR
jgi:hypothetical protein